MIRQIPNIFTLLNLFFGCMAIVCVVQSGITVTYDNYLSENILYRLNYLSASGINFTTDGTTIVILPPNICMGAVFIGCAAVIDFLDGFVARLLKASSEMGKQLDSLADVVSFGVAPGMILYEFLRLAWAQQPNGFDTNSIWLLPAFILPCAGAYRLARFNIDTTQSYGFKGVPIPAAGLVIASYPLIYWYSNEVWAIKLITNQWFLYATILVISYLMVSTLPMMAMKFKNYSVKSNWPKYLLILITIIAAIVFKWLAAPIVFVLYVVLSLAVPQKNEVST